MVTLRLLSFTLSILALGTAALSGAEATDDRLGWWREAKVGLAIAWGPVAVTGGAHGTATGYGEGLLSATTMPLADYRAIAQRFNPTEADPAGWVRMAKDAGLRYVVLSAKHVDGFALWPSAASTWDVADASAYGQDLVEPLAKAARQEGLRLGLHYSQAQDLMHPGGAKPGTEDGGGWDDGHRGRFDDYLAQVAVPQVQELLARYQPDLLWWDTPILMTPARAGLFTALLTQHPSVLTNNRLGGNQAGDFTSISGIVPLTVPPAKPFEVRLNVGRFTTFNATDTEFKSASELIRRTAEVASQGGNLLLGVAPDAAGRIPTPVAERLGDLGRWLRLHGEAIYGTEAGPFPRLPWGCVTRKDERLYLHVLAWPKDGRLRLPLASGVKGAHLLATPDTALVITKDATGLVITVPATPIDARNTVIVVTLDGPPKALPLVTVGATVEATGSEDGQPVTNILDRNTSRRWMAPVGAAEAQVTITLAQPEKLAALALDEPDVWPRLRQHLRVEADSGNGQWITIGKEVTTGIGAFVELRQVTTKRLRLSLANPKSRLGLAEVVVLRAD